jgi:hypothetical protein
MVFFMFPENARWNADRREVEFGVEVGEYQAVVRVPRRVSSTYSRRRRHRNAVSKPIISTEPASNSS